MPRVSAQHVVHQWATNRMKTTPARHGRSPEGRSGPRPRDAAPPPWHRRGAGRRGQAGYQPGRPAVAASWQAAAAQVADLWDDRWRRCGVNVPVFTAAVPFRLQPEGWLAERHGTASGMARRTVADGHHARRRVAAWPAAQTGPLGPRQGKQAQSAPRLWRVPGTQETGTPAAGAAHEHERRNPPVFCAGAGGLPSGSAPDIELPTRCRRRGGRRCGTLRRSASPRSAMRHSRSGIAVLARSVLAARRARGAKSPLHGVVESMVDGESHRQAAKVLRPQLYRSVGGHL